MNTTSAPSTTRTVLQILCKRWDAKPWEFQELVAYDVFVERETEKAVLVVDNTSKQRRSTWMPKRAMVADKNGTLSPWAASKFSGARFSETEVYSIGGR